MFTLPLKRTLLLCTALLAFGAAPCQADGSDVFGAMSSLLSGNTQGALKGASDLVDAKKDIDRKTSCKRQCVSDFLAARSEPGKTCAQSHSCMQCYDDCDK